MAYDKFNYETNAWETVNNPYANGPTMGADGWLTPEQQAAQAAAWEDTQGGTRGKTQSYKFDIPGVGVTTLSGRSADEILQQLGQYGVQTPQSGWRALQNNDPEQGGNFLNGYLGGAIAGDMTRVGDRASGGAWTEGGADGSYAWNPNYSIDVSQPKDSGFDKFMSALAMGLPLGVMGAGLFGALGGTNPLGSLDSSISNLFGGGNNGITSSIGYGANPTAVSSAGGNGMWDWLDQLTNLGDTSSTASNLSNADILSQIGYNSSAPSQALNGFDFANSYEAQALKDAGITAPTGSITQQLVDAGIPFESATKLSSVLGNNGSSLLKSLLGNGTSSGIGSLLGKLGAAGLGAYASNQQANSLNDLANKYDSYGAPYRAQLSSLMANPNSFINSNEVQVPVQQGTNALMRSLSTSGNPFGSGNALQQGQNYASNSFYDKLQGKENQLAAFGGLANFNSSAPGAATAAIGAQGNAANAIGAGLNDIFNPPKTLAENLAAYKSLIG